MALGFASALAAGSMEVARGIVVVGYDDAAVTAGLTRTETMMRRGGSAGLMAKGVLGIGTAFGLVAGLSGKMAINFQNQMRLIQTSAGATAKDVQYLTKQILDLAKSGTSPYGPTELSRAMFHLKSIGYDNVTAMGILKAAVQGAKIGFGDLETTTSALGAAMRAVFGDKGTAVQAQQTMGVLNGIVGSGNMRLQDLISSLGTGVLGAATTAGLKLIDVGAALAVLVDQGQNANMAATRLRMSFSLMGAPTKKAAAELASIGIGAKDLLRQLGSGHQGLLGGLELLKNHLNAAFDLSTKVGREDAFALLSKAFGGGRSAGAIMILLNHLELLQQKYGQVATIAKRTNAEIAASDKTAAVQIQESWAKIQADFMKFGNAVLPVIAGFARGIAHVADFISNHSQYFAALATVLGLIGVQMLAVSVYSRLAGVGLAVATAGMSRAGASAAIAAGEVSVLRGLLLGLTTIGTILIIVDILFRPKGPTDWLKKHIPYFKSMGDWVDSKVPFLRKVDEAHGLLAPGEGGRPMGANPYKKGTALYRAWAAGAEGHHIARKDLSVATAKAWQAGHEWRKKLDASAHDKAKGKGNKGNDKSGAGAGGGIPYGGGKPIPLPYNILKAEADATQTRSDKDDLAAYKSERAWIERQLRNKRLTKAQRLDFATRLGQADQQIFAIEDQAKSKSDAAKKKHEREARAAAKKRDALNIPQPLLLGIAKAKGTLTDDSDDIRAYTAEEKWLTKEINKANNSKKRLTKLYAERAKIRKDIAALRKKDKSSRDAANAERMAFLVNLRDTFLGQMASDVFTRTQGKLSPGSSPSSSPSSSSSVTTNNKTVNVHQHFPTAPESRLAEYRSAMYAAEVAA